MKVADLFCGAGGMSIGLQAAGHNVVYAADSWSVAVEHYNRNVGDHAVVANIGVDDLEIPDVDLIAGGPPCQDFSVANVNEKKGRANLTVAYAELVARRRCPWFIMENVPPVVEFEEYKQAMDVFKTAGYDVVATVYKLSRYGVPQLRKRLIAVGRLGGLPDAMKMWGLPESPIGSVREHFEKVGVPLEVSDYFAKPRTYESRSVWSTNELAPTVRSTNTAPRRHFFAPPRERKDKTVFDVNELSPTIRSNNSGPTQRTPDHPRNPVPPQDVKPLTERQRAIVQTFPPDYDWQGTKTALNTMIGNAVPPVFAECLGRWIGENA